jgi:phosphoglycolate phosphatase-like HAD superfamily hydrolase
MRCAAAAGMRPFGVLWGFRDAAELTACGAEALLTGPSDLLDYLD